MKQVIFQTTTLSVVESSDHVFILSSKDVAIGYGISTSTLRSNQNNNQDELIEGKHFIIDRSYKNTPKTMWTKIGVITLGFFIKSEKAKAFRKWAANYVLEGSEPDNDLKEIILAQNAQIAKLTIELNKKPKRLPPPPLDDTLRQTLVKVHDGYHRILTSCSPIDMMKELSAMTCLFQCIASGKNDGKNLNTCTKSGHTCWNRPKLLS